MRDLENGLYGVGPYFLGKIACDGPSYIFCPTLLVTIVYWTVGLQPIFSKYVASERAYVFLRTKTRGGGGMGEYYCYAEEPRVLLLSRSFAPRIAPSRFAPRIAPRRSAPRIAPSRFAPRRSAPHIAPRQYNSSLRSLCVLFALRSSLFALRSSLFAQCAVTIILSPLANSLLQQSIN